MDRTQPSARWTQLPSADGPLTFVIADQWTTWKLVVDRPGAPNVFELVEPTTTLMSNDTIKLRHTPASGMMTPPKVTVQKQDGTVVMEYTPLRLVKGRNARLT